jgi:hypothetical protein
MRLSSQCTQIAVRMTNVELGGITSGAQFSAAPGESAFDLCLHETLIHESHKIRNFRFHRTECTYIVRCLLFRDVLAVVPVGSPLLLLLYAGAVCSRVSP